MKPGAEVLYSIIVPGLTDQVAIETARRTLVSNNCPVGLVHIGDNSVSVPRLYTLWRGENAEQIWQAQIKTALPTALIDVQPWSHVPGYPQGEMGEVTNATTM